MPRPLQLPHFALDLASGVPVFKQIMDQVKFLVASGNLVAGQPLPPTRALATQLGINPMTVSKAYRYLEKEEVVRYRPGKSVVVSPSLEGFVGREKRAQLRRALNPCVLVTRQLGLDTKEAVSIFSEMLAGKPKVAEIEPPDPHHEPVREDDWQNW